MFTYQFFSNVESNLQGRVEFRVRLPPQVTASMPPDYTVVLDGKPVDCFPSPDEFRVDANNVVTFVWTFVARFPGEMMVMLSAQGPKL